MRSVKTTPAVVGSVFFMVLAGCGSGREQMLARRWGFIDKTGTSVIQLQFLQAGEFSDGSAPVQSAASAKWGYVDRRGNVVIAPQFDNVAGFTEGLACVEPNHKMGYVDKTGKMVIAAIYVDARPFSEGLAEVTVKWSSLGSGREAIVSYIDRTGKPVIPPRFRDSYVPVWVNPYSKPPGDFSEGLAGLILDKDARGDHRGYIDRNGNVVLEPPNAVLVGRFSEGLAAVGLKGKVGFVDHAGKFVIDPAFQSGSIPLAHVFSEGLATVAVGGKLGFIDRTGKMIIGPQFDWVTDFSEGRAITKMDGGDPIYIDKTGRHIFQAFRVHADEFSEGLAAAPMRTWSGLFEPFPDVLFSGQPRWGFIDEKGETVIRAQFDDAHSFSEGLAAVARFILVPAPQK
jgi:WG containing repeat